MERGKQQQQQLEIAKQNVQSEKRCTRQKSNADGVCSFARENDQGK